MTDTTKKIEKKIEKKMRKVKTVKDPYEADEEFCKFSAKHTYDDFLNYLRKHKNDDLEIKYDDYNGDNQDVPIEKVKVYPKAIYGCYHFEKENALWKTRDVCSPYVAVKILFKRDMREYSVKSKEDKRKMYRMKDPFRRQLENIWDDFEAIKDEGYDLDNSDHVFQYIIEHIFSINNDTYWLDVYEEDTTVYDSSDNSDNEGSDDE